MEGDRLPHVFLRSSASATGLYATREVRRVCSESCARLLNDYEVLILDNLTGLYRTLLEEVLSQPSKSGKRLYEDHPNMGDYGVVSERMRHILSGLKARYLEKRQTVIAVTHVKCDTNTDGVKVAGYPTYRDRSPPT